MPCESRCSASVRHPRLHFGFCSSATPTPASSSAHANWLFMVAFYHSTELGRVIQRQATQAARQGNPVHPLQKKAQNVQANGQMEYEGVAENKPEKPFNYGVASPKCFVRIFQHPKSVLVLPSGSFTPAITWTWPLGSIIATGNSNL